MTAPSKYADLTVDIIQDSSNGATLEGPAPEGTEADVRAAVLRSRLLSSAQIIAMPAPIPLVGDVLTAGSLSVLWGKPGSGKSFVALDWALSVGTGSWWLGREVNKGVVLYVAAEGIGGLGARIEAWQTSHRVYEVSADTVRFLPGTLNLLDSAWAAAAVALAGDLKPSYVVFDTLARTMIGGDENSARDMGVVIDAANAIQASCGAAVTLVHHDTKEGSTMRGSSALLGACDTSIECRADGQAVNLRCEKAKDQAPFEPISLWREVVGKSCAITTPPAGSSESLSGVGLEVLVGLAGVNVPEGVSTTVWLHSSGVAVRSFYRWQKKLVDLGLVGSITVGANKRYTLTEQGESTLAAQTLPTANVLPSTAMTGGQLLPPHHPLLGGGSGTGTGTGTGTGKRREIDPPPRDEPLDEEEW